MAGWRAPTIVRYGVAQQNSWSDIREWHQLMPRFVVTALALIIAAATVASVVRLRAARARRGPLVASEDCVVSECAADGVPLSDYAG